MAHIRKVKYKSTVSYNCIVKRIGFKTISRNFDTKIGAKKWARTKCINITIKTIF